jgi:hypothetical protein
MGSVTLPVVGKSRRRGSASWTDRGDGCARGAGTLPLGAWAKLLTLALDEAAGARGNVKTTAKTKAKTATHTSRRFGSSDDARGEPYQMMMHAPYEATANA